MLCWILWPHKETHDGDPDETAARLDLVNEVRGLEARLNRILAQRAARRRLREDADAAIRALRVPTEGPTDDDPA